MKQPLLGAMEGLAFVGSSLTAHAVPFDFTYTGSLVTFTVPTTDSYQILAFGAQGGNFDNNNIFNNVFGPGGLGAEIGGDFRLTAGEILQIAVGGAGNNIGGGGGSFVVGPGSTPLVIAGGGGGGGQAADNTGLPGGGGLTGQDGGGPNGGINGNGGGGDTGGGGGGFFSGGGSFDSGLPTGGGGYPDLTGGPNGGGFGGGGGEHAMRLAFVGAGGGGGYSGGSGGSFSLGGIGPGSGGGSFDGGIDQILVADFRMGNGEVIITELAAAIPEPASIALLGAGLLSLAALRRRRRAEYPAE